MSFSSRSVRRLALVLVVLGSCWVRPSGADDWLVYLGGGLEPIEGGWDLHKGRVLFTKLGGTLVSIPAAEVDLPTSAFITYQLNGRRQAPPRAPLAPKAEPVTQSDDQRVCVKGRIKALLDGETLEIETEGVTETVHVACLDAPDTRHRFAELGWFGRAAVSSLELGLRKSGEVCLAETLPPRRDKQGHRIVYVRLASGKDFAAEMIKGGLGLLRLGPCERAAAYRRLEDRAIADQAGLWGEMSEKAAFAAAGKTVVIGAGGAGPPPPRRIGGG